MSETLEANPDIKAVYVVSPTYYGVASGPRGHRAVAHEHDVPLLVDEAWGPHFHFHPSLPTDAMAAGADMCINSTHKMIGSMSQTAMLHMQGKRIHLDRLKAVYKLFLSTSPNLVFVASLDVARRQMATTGEALLRARSILPMKLDDSSTRFQASIASDASLSTAKVCTTSIRPR